MKFSVTILLSVIVAIYGAAIDSEPFDDPSSFGMIIPDSLFEKAWEYQDEVTALQQDIDETLTEIRTAVSLVLKSSSRETLGQIENNAHALMDQDAPARGAIFAEGSSPCINNLKVLINAITEFTGFGSSNCVTTYDKSVQGTLSTAKAFLQKYEESFSNVQQIVVRSFIGKNAFVQYDEIEARFGEQYNLRKSQWDAFRPDVEEFVRTLDANIAVFNTALGECFVTIQQNVAPAYDELQGEIQTCLDFNSTPDPFAMYR